MSKKVIFSTVVTDEVNLVKIKNTFEKNGYEVVCVITHNNWLPIVKKVMPNVETHWLDNFLDTEDWKFPLLAEAQSIISEGSSIMPLALVERHQGFYGTLESEIRLLHQSSLAEDILNRHKPDLFVSWYSVERALDYSIYKICKKRNIPVLMTRSAGFKRLISCTSEIASPLIQENGEVHPSITGINNLQVDETAYSFIRTAVEKIRRKEPSLFQVNEIKRGNKRQNANKFSKFTFFSNSFKSIGIKKTFIWLVQNGLKSNDLYFKYLLLKNYSQRAEKFIKQQEFSYIYFPLHFQPELTSMPIGDGFVNQIKAIKILSDSVDEQTVILVKEHPSTFSTKTTINRKFKNEFMYDWLAKIPKVKIISIDEDVDHLLENSNAVATINGNIASEALVSKKPVLLFADNFLFNAPGMFRVSDATSIKNALLEIQTLTLSDEKVDAFLENLCKYTWCISRDNDEEVIFNDLIMPEITNALLTGFEKEYGDNN